ncbi:MAG: thiol-disulfide oxidoreductase [Sphingobacteriaceae bacterium]|nr:thiol-disulfide oxidoreductase [Sphingobacteriaceae bacterium]
MDSNLKNKTILLFDGYCNLCHSSVQFVLKHEKNNEIYFTSLQSPTGIEILNHYSINPKEIDSLVLIEKNKAYIKSTAALRITKYLKGLYPIGFGLLIIPSFIRNWVYDYVAKNRYKWFGKMDNCLVPDGNLLKRFL